jgi:hypothetical protein
MLKIDGPLSPNALVEQFSPLHALTRSRLTLTLIHTGVVSIALLNFEEILLKKS